MRSQPVELPRFSRGTPVLDYWVAHSEGFLVRSGGFRRQRVQAVVRDPHHGRTIGLVVRSALGRRRMLAVDAVAAVDPAEGVLLLQDAPAAGSTRAVAAAAAARTRRGGAAAWTWAGPRAARTAALTWAGCLWLAPRARAHGREAILWTLATAAALAGATGRASIRIWRAAEPQVARAIREARRRARER